MSSYGLVLCNSLSQIQVDGEHKNFVYQESGTWERDRDGEGVGGSGVTQISFSTAISSGVPIVALRPRGGSDGFSACPKGFIKSGSSFTGFNLKWKYLVYPDDDAVDWIVFRPILGTEAISSDYGINVYNSSGDLVWSSDAKSMKLVGGTKINPEYYETPPYEDATNHYFFVYPPYSRYVYGGTYWNIMWNCLDGVLVVNFGLMGYWETSDETHILPTLMEVTY